MSMNSVFASFTYDFHAQRKPFGGRFWSDEHHSLRQIATTSASAKACKGYGHAWLRSRDAHVHVSVHQDLVAVCSKYFRSEEKTEVIELTGSAGWSTEQ